MSAAVTFVMVLATAVTWPIYQYLLVPNGLAYLQTIVFILIIAALVPVSYTHLDVYKRQHIVLTVILLGIIGVIIWLFSSSHPQNDVYENTSLAMGLSLIHIL